MHGLRAIYFVPMVFSNIVETKGFLSNGNSNNSDPIHGSSGHNVDTTDILQMLLNQTTELENLKRQVENDKSTIKELETFKQQAENDRITMQNRVFLLETELTKLNATKTPSNQEFSTYLMSMNQLIQNMAANEENDKNLTNHLNAAVKQLAELQHALLNQSTELELYKQQSESDRSKVYSIQNFTQKTDEKVNDLKTDMIQTRLNQTNELRDIKQQLEREKSKEYMLQNLTQRMSQRLDDLNLQVRYTSLSLLDLHAATEQLNGSLLQQLEERISNVHDHISASMNVIKKRFTISRLC
ncbi:uncharacterized protein LOC111102709 [Crassostrea virginica]